MMIKITMALIAIACILGIVGCIYAINVFKEDLQICLFLGMSIFINTIVLIALLIGKIQITD